MGEQRNLTEENVDELTEKLNKMQETNPELEFRFFKQILNEEQPEEQPDVAVCQPSNHEIYEKLEAIQVTLKHIFGGHVLIDGQFVKVT